ncbi:PREDICTED: SUMO-activating enzyme subunit 1A [Camelina sativa]|uniref:SUMO-activating enzyme subunit 1A n=1 Tax=Camelina sativa TaxID=90675 RepID=A0ABM0UZB2_CAMSA|nr:PREDICTED: SUMO-activating enzyme subunit 1A [Camelina sativa]
MDGEELTEQETALYDRQIRVWGANAQRRLTKSHVLVSGIKGTVAEFCKNIVLAGVGSVTLMDDRLVNEEALNANFLIPPDENAYRGNTVAEICCDSLKDFNPMVRVSVEKGDLSTLGLEFFEKFDVVVIGYGSRATKKSVNEKCRNLVKRVAFYTVDCRDSCGEIFVDLQNYKYTKKKREETVECELNFPSFQEAISVPWKPFPRRTAKLYFAMRVIEVFEESEGRKHGECSLLDLARVLEIKKQLCEANSVSESLIPDSLLERLITGTTEFPPACAIVGGILAQEVIKAVSCKGDPLKNFFYFDGEDGKGVMEDISNSFTSS